MAENGDDRANTFLGTSANEVYNGLGGNDLIFPDLGSDTIDGGAGTDTVSYFDDAGDEGVTATYSSKDEAEVTRGEDTDTLKNFELLDGTAYDDDVTGNVGQQIFRGNAGDDTFDGKEGVDAIFYDLADDASHGTTVNLDDGEATDPFGDTDTLTSVENVLGSGFDDTIIGESGVENTFDGGGGNDTFEGNAGADTLLGGGGNDVAVYSGDKGDYALDFADGEVTVTDGSGTTDTLTEIGTLRFDDGDVSAPGVTAASGTIELPDGSPLSDATILFVPDDSRTVSDTTDGSGGFGFDIAGAGRVDLPAGAEGPTADGISASDALQVLRIAVGLDPTFGEATPGELIAADVNGDEKVNSSDALEVLRFAVDLDADGAGTRVLLDDDADLSGITASNVDFTSGIAVDGSDASLSGTAVTLGDLGTFNAV